MNRDFFTIQLGIVDLKIESQISRAAQELNWTHHATNEMKHKLCVSHSIG